MVSIIAGNGINFGIIYMARYIEARRAQESISEPSSPRIAKRTSRPWLPQPRPWSPTDRWQ